MLYRRHILLCLSVRYNYTLKVVSEVKKLGLTQTHTIPRKTWKRPPKSWGSPGPIREAKKNGRAGGAEWGWWVGGGWIFLVFLGP